MVSSEKKRYLSSFIFIPILILLSHLGGYYFLFFVNLMILLGGIEFFRMANQKGANVLAVPGVFFSLFISWFAFVTAGKNLPFLITVLILLVMVIELLRKNSSNALYRIGTVVLGIVYVGWMGSHFVLLRELPRVLSEPYQKGSHYVLLVFLATWGCDTAAYMLGRKVGRYPLMKEISPKKSLEGAVGGLFFAIIFSLVGKFWFAHFLSVPQSIIFGLLVGVSGQLGDLVESLFKRDVDTKDSSGIIPGHGGVLDRFDSLLFAAPLAYYYLRMVLK